MKAQRAVRHAPRAMHAAFSLLEVVIALTILALISTTLFAIIKGSVKGASDIQRTQRENDELNRFFELCRQTFHMMPASATFKLTATGQAGESSQELAISGVPFCFGFGTDPISYEATTIALRPDLAHPTTEDGAPRYTAGITRKDIVPSQADGQTTGQPVSDPTVIDDQGRYWMPVLPGVTLMKWRFFKDSSDEWLEDWSDSKWPELVELQLQMEGRNIPIRMVWATPEMTLRSATNKTPSSSTKGGK
jgi:prepilin-type N-terminal cleavage/methylation domain-containing protein